MSAFFSFIAHLVAHLAALLQPVFHASAAAAAIVLFTALVRLLVHPLVCPLSCPSARLRTLALARPSARDTACLPGFPPAYVPASAFAHRVCVLRISPAHSQ